jgi:hypothetical protein
MEKDNPIIAFIRDLKLFERNLKINKTAAAINYWLLYDQTDLPLEICKLSFDSYTTPVAKDGTLPVKLFGRPLNFKRAKEQGIKWLICVAEKDDWWKESLDLTEWWTQRCPSFQGPRGHRHQLVHARHGMFLTSASTTAFGAPHGFGGGGRQNQAAAAQKVSRDKARLEADLKLAAEKAKAEPVAALPTAGDKIQAAAPQTVPEQKPRSVEALKAMEGKAEPQDAAPAPEDPTQSAGQKAEKNTAQGTELQKPEA